MKNSPYVFDDLLGRWGLYSPWSGCSSVEELAKKSLGRPLPTIRKGGACALCGGREVDEDYGFGVVARPNEVPISGQHWLIMTLNHVVNPSDMTADMWFAYLKACNKIRSKIFAETGKESYVYGNLGGKAGGSEEHFHVQVLCAEDSWDLTVKPESHVSCLVCSSSRPQLVVNASAKGEYVHGGRSGEILITGNRHGVFSSYSDSELSDVAKILHASWNAYGRVWDSGLITHHFYGQGDNRHEYLRVAPSVSAVGTLESQFGIMVNRLSPETVAMLFEK